eukprot:SAG31_NODE_1065_length_10096_cov_7.151530_10_plen_93_part_00
MTRATLRAANARADRLWWRDIWWDSPAGAFRVVVALVRTAGQHDSPFHRHVWECCRILRNNLHEPANHLGSTRPTANHSAMRVERAKLAARH